MQPDQRALYYTDSLNISIVKMLHLFQPKLQILIGYYANSWRLGSDPYKIISLYLTATSYKQINM